MREGTAVAIRTGMKRGNNLRGVVNVRFRVRNRSVKNDIAGIAPQPDNVHGYTKDTNIRAEKYNCKHHNISRNGLSSKLQTTKTRHSVLLRVAYFTRSETMLYGNFAGCVSGSSPGVNTLPIRTEIDLSKMIHKPE